MRPTFQRAPSAAPVTPTAASSPLDLSTLRSRIGFALYALSVIACLSMITALLERAAA